MSKERSDTYSIQVKSDPTGCFEVDVKDITNK